MERLTTDRDYLADKAIYERHLAQGYPRSTPQERFLKLCEYERTGHTPEEITEFDRMYLDKCEEVNRLKAELAEYKKNNIPPDVIAEQPQGDLISKNALIEKMNDTGVQITFNLPVEEILGADVDMDDFAMLVQDAIKAYRKMVIDTIQAQPSVYDVEKVVEQLDKNCFLPDNYLGFAIDAELAVDIVRSGGKE